MDRTRFLREAAASTRDSAFKSEAVTHVAGIVLLGALLIFSPLIEGGTTHLAIMGIRFIVLALLGICLRLTIKKGELAWIRFSITAPVLAYMVLAVVVTGFSPYTNQSLQWLMVLSTYVLLLYLIVFLAVQWKDVYRLLIVLTLMGIGEAGWALIQVYTAGVVRPTGTFFNPNFLAGYLSAIFTVVLGMGICSRFCSLLPHDTQDQEKIPFHSVGDRKENTHDSSWLWRAVWMGVLVLLLSGIFVTGSRGGLIALLAGSGFVISLQLSRRGLWVVVICIAIMVCTPNPIQQRIRAEHAMNPVAYSRLQIWKQSLVAIIDAPLGRGLGMYQYIYPQYAIPIENQISRFGTTAQMAHNEYLQMGVELGVLGVVLFCWGIVRMGQDLRQVLNRHRNQWQRGVIVGASGALVAILAHGTVDANLHEPAIAIVFTVSAGFLLMAIKTSRNDGSAVVTIGVRPKWMWVTCGILSFGCLVVLILKTGLAWHYFEQGSRFQVKSSLDRAIASYTKAIALDPGKALYHSALASAHFQIFRQNRASHDAQATLAEMNEAIELNPVDGRLYGILGHIYGSSVEAFSGESKVNSQSNDLAQEAVKAYQRAIELDPNSPFYRLELARLLSGLSQRQQAFEVIKRAIELEPNFLPAREWLIRWYLSSGDERQKDLAVREFREIIQRQDRYLASPKNSLEERYLTVDISKLAADLKRLKQQRT